MAESKIWAEAQELNEQLVTWRRYLHQIPELGINLPQTTAYVAEQLTKLGVDHEVFEDVSCIVATIGKGDRCILLRGDMDGLPGEEQSGEEFSSTNGCMHACGHDIHPSALLGAAKILKAHEDELNGVVKLLFQSGEEVFKGSEAAIKAGVLENPKVDAAYGMHVFAQPEIGEVQFGDIIMGAVFGFKITVTGVGGHGSQPENCIDPINAAVAIYQAFQSLIARELPSYEEGVLTIGQFQAGQAANAIPDKAVLQGTLRTFKPAIKEMMMRRIREVAESVGQTYRCTVEVETLSNVPSVMCDAELTETFLGSIRKLGIMHKETPGLHLIGSEDFANISAQVPSTYFIIGGGMDNPEERLAQHNPKIRFNEKCLPMGAAIYAQIALDFLK